LAGLVRSMRFVFVDHVYYSENHYICFFFSVALISVLSFFSSCFSLSHYSCDWKLWGSGRSSHRTAEFL
jgi:hypothetical protein